MLAVLPPLIFDVLSTSGFARSTGGVPRFATLLMVGGEHNLHVWYNGAAADSFIGRPVALMVVHAAVWYFSRFS